MSLLSAPPYVSSRVMAASFSALDGDLLQLVFCHLAAADLARCRALCHALRLQAESEPLWERACIKAGLTRNGSSRPTSRTYRSWRGTWWDARCAECGDTYVYKVNLDGGSFSATMWHGAQGGAVPRVRL